MGINPIRSHPDLWPDLRRSGIPQHCAENFTFYLNGFGGGGTTYFTADVYAWSGSLIAGNPVQGAMGSALYTSPLMSITDNLSGNFQQVTVNTGGVLLTPNVNYVALLTTTDPGSMAANANSNGSWAFVLYYFSTYRATAAVVLISPTVLPL